MKLLIIYLRSKYLPYQKYEDFHSHEFFPLKDVRCLLFVSTNRMPINTKLCNKFKKMNEKLL